MVKRRGLVIHSTRSYPLNFKAFNRGMYTWCLHVVFTRGVYGQTLVWTRDDTDELKLNMWGP